MATRSITPTGPSGQNPQYQFTSILAEWIGLNEAIVIQHLHTLLGESNQIVSADGKQWICRTLDDYQADFPFWDRGIIKRTIRNLKQDALISSRSDLNYATGDRSSWYTINHENLSLLSGPVDRLQAKAIKRRQARDSRVFDHRPGFVYLCKTPNRKGYKIGLSADTNTRMRGLGSTLLHLIPTNDMIQTEQELHKRFEDKRLNSEYFDLTENDIQEILSIK
jgi:hypothetical protein